MSAAELSRAVDLLVRQVAHWEQPRWSAATGTGVTRAEVLHALVQRLADLGAAAEGRPGCPVPRADDHVLPDQLRVLAADLVRADPPADVLDTATSDVAAVRRQI